MQSVSNDIKPEPIKDHGTVVILLGDDEQAMANFKARWLATTV
jgi:hypothetical protein